MQKRLSIVVYHTHAVIPFFLYSYSMTRNIGLGNNSNTTKSVHFLLVQTVLRNINSMTR